MKTLSKTIFPKDCVNYPNTLGLYLAEDMLGYTKFIFDDDFIHLTRYTLSTDCISEFTQSQLDFFMEWVDYNVSRMNNEISYIDNEAVTSFDQELIKITECIPDPGEIICGNSNLHTYNACP